MLKSSLCDCSNLHKFVMGTITITGGTAATLTRKK